MLQLKKRECDIKISLTPVGGMCLKVEFDIGDEHLEFVPSSAMAGQFGDFVNAFYALFYELQNYGSDNHREQNTNISQNTVDGITYISTRTSWDEEGTGVDIVFERRFHKGEENWDYSDTVDMSFLMYRDKKTKKSFTLNTKELCYAIAKACTDVLKTYGFYGYRLATEWDYFKVYQLLYIKAMALDCMEIRQCRTSLPQTRFKDEIELLLFDM